MGKKLRGTGVGTGLVWGPAAVFSPPPGLDPHETPTPADSARIREALAAVSANLKTQAAKGAGESAEILAATAQMATDRGLTKKIDTFLASGLGATAALHAAVAQYAEMLTALGGYMAQRVTDLYDVRDRALARLRGLPEPGITITNPCVILASDLSPSQLASLDLDNVKAIALTQGGTTSHLAILCIQAGIPLLVQVNDLEIHPELVSPGDLVAVNASTGELWLEPETTELTFLRKTVRQRDEVLVKSTGPGATADETPLPLLANIGTAADAVTAVATGVEGCGLFRTEFLFLNRCDTPSFDEQVTAYTQVLQAFAGSKVVARTLDAGADKPLGFITRQAEENPALGVRGLRLCQKQPELLETQLLALAAAGANVLETELWVMAPMVSTATESAWFQERARAAGLKKIGVMIEVPAAALRAPQVLQGLDFASIGTNDLAQYTMAADRMSGELGELQSPWQPAVLELIAQTCRASALVHDYGESNGKNNESKHIPIGVCGEAAADPALALVLVGLGVNSLSMAVSRIPAVRAALRLHSLAQCEQLATAALAAPSATAARQTVLSVAQPGLSALL